MSLFWEITAPSMNLNMGFAKLIKKTKTEKNIENFHSFLKSFFCPKKTLPTPSPPLKGKLRVPLVSGGSLVGGKGVRIFFLSNYGAAKYFGQGVIKNESIFSMKNAKIVFGVQIHTWRRD